MKRFVRQKQNRGIALIMVISVLALLTAIAAPFAISMLYQGKGAKLFEAGVRAETRAKSGMQWAIARLHLTHLDYDPTPDSDTLKELNDLVDIRGGGSAAAAEIRRHFEVDNPRGGMLYVSVEDEQGRFNIHGAMNWRFELGNLLGATRLSSELSENETTMNVESTEGFEKDGGFLAIYGGSGFELLSYDRAASGRFTGLSRFLEGTRAHWPQLPGFIQKHARGARVYHASLLFITQEKTSTGIGALSSIVRDRVERLVPYVTYYAVPETVDYPVNIAPNSPININTAPEEALYALLYDRVYSDDSGNQSRVDPTMARDIVRRLMDQREQTPFATPNSLNGFINSIIGVGLPTQDRLGIGTVNAQRIAFKSNNVFRVESIGVENDPAGNQLALRRITQVVEIVPARDYTVTLDFTADFQNYPLKMTQNLDYIDTLPTQSGADLGHLRLKTENAPSSGNLYQGIFNNTPEGKDIGGGFTLTGGQVATMSGLNVTPGSVSMWVCLNDISSDVYFFDLNNGADYEDRIFFRYNAGRRALELGICDATITRATALTSVNFTMEPRCWYHIGADWRSTKEPAGFIYVDGQWCPMANYGLPGPTVPGLGSAVYTKSAVDVLNANGYSARMANQIRLGNVNIPNVLMTGGGTLGTDLGTDTSTSVEWVPTPTKPGAPSGDPLSVVDATGLPDKGVVKIVGGLDINGNPTGGTDYAAYTKGGNNSLTLTSHGLHGGSQPAFYPNGATVTVVAVAVNNFANYPSPALISVDNEWFGPVVVDGGYLYRSDANGDLLFQQIFPRGSLGTTVAGHSAGTKIYQVIALTGNQPVQVGDTDTIINDARQKEQVSIAQVRSGGGTTYVVLGGYTNRAYDPANSSRFLSFPSGELPTAVPASVQILPGSSGLVDDLYFSNSVQQNTWVGSLQPEIRNPDGSIRTPADDLPAGANQMPPRYNGRGQMRLVNIEGEWILHEADGRIPPGGRGLFGSGARDHLPGNRVIPVVQYLLFKPVMPTENVTQNASAFGVVAPNGLPNMGTRNLCMGGEVISYQNIVGTGTPGYYTINLYAQGTLRGNFGSSVQNHSPMTPGFLLMSRYKDEYRDNMIRVGPTGPMCPFYHFKMYQRRALWKSFSVNAGNQADKRNCDLMTRLRVDRTPVWDANSLPLMRMRQMNGQFAAWSWNTPMQADCVEMSFYPMYAPGSFQDNSWRVSAELRRVSAVYYKEPIVLYSEMSER